jgi:hypothetical protein
VLNTSFNPKKANQGMEVDWEKLATFFFLPRSSQNHLFYSFQYRSKLFQAPHASRYVKIERS